MNPPNPLQTRVEASLQAISPLADRVEGSVHQYSAESVRTRPPLTKIARVSAEGAREKKAGKTAME